MFLTSDISKDQFYEKIHPQPTLWINYVKDVCSLINVKVQHIRPFSDGVNLVACVNDSLVVKIFPPFHLHQWESDSHSLNHLQGRLSLSIPNFIASGELKDAWTYLVMSKLEGTSLELVWANLSHKNKLQLMKNIGKTMAEVHANDVGELHNLRPEWTQFIASQVLGCKARHEKKGMPRWFMEGLESWVNNSLGLIENEPRRVILAGEYTPFNLLVQQDGDDFHLSGMIDFGDAMIGLPEYDFLGPSVFLGEGDPDLISALFNGYGYSDTKDVDKLRRKLLLLQILHRYSDFKSQLRIGGWEDRIQNFEDLAELIWPL